MVRSFLLILSLLCIGSWAIGQTTLQGTITEPAGPAFSANIKVLKGTNLVAGAVADFDGKYFINVDPGTYDVEFSYVGYSSEKQTGVQILAGRANYLNKVFKSDDAGVTLGEVVIKEYRAPLIDKDNTSQGAVVTAEQIRNLPTKSVNSIVATTAGTSSVEGGDVSIRGSRENGTNYYIDGIRTSKNQLPPSQDIDQLQVITGGLGAEYGDVTGGVISIFTKGPASKFSGGLEFETSKKLDAFGYTQANGNVSGPLIRKKSGETMLGFRLSGTAQVQDDDDIPAIPVYSINDEAYARLTAHPITKQGFSVLNSAETLTNADVNVTKSRRDEGSRNLDGTAKLDFRLNRAIDVSVTGTYADVRDKFTPDKWGVLNSRQNPTQLTNRSRGIIRFRHRLGGATEDSKDSKDAKSAVISNAQYTLSFGAERNNYSRQDKNHGDRFFDYGYIGKFNYRRDSVIGFDNGLPHHVGYQKVFTGYEAGTINPVLAAFNEFANPEDESTYLRYNGLNVSGYNEIWNGIHANVGSVYNSYQRRQGDVYTLNATAGFDLSPGGSKNGRHSIQFGLTYEQRIDRSYSLAPYSLFNIADLQSNINIIGVDTNDILRWVIYPPTGDSIPIYNTKSVEQTDSKFYKEIRKSLGLSEHDFVNVQKLTPDQLSLSQFSAKELTDQEVLAYYGYDYLGNKLPSTTTFNDFFTKKDAQGNRLFPVLARTPVYQAAYIQDKFQYRDIIFRVGLRVDRYDANTKVLKDPYSLYEVMSADEFYTPGVSGLNKPANVQGDWKVYVADGDEKQVVAYRKGEQFYNGSGTASDGNVIFGGGVVTPRLKDKNANIKSETFDPNGSFADYSPTVNWTPRLAFSFPISDDAGFFAHYDILVQRPPNDNDGTSHNFLSPLDYFYFYDNRPNTRNASNADLKPERTIDYEVGFQQKLNNNSAIKMSAYYKELRDMIQQRFYLYIPVINSYQTYGNLDFGTVKGFSFAYDLRRIQNAQLTLAYTLQFADGTGSDANSQSGSISTRGNLRTLYPLNFDERHNIQAVLDYRFDKGKKYNGPRVNGKNILAELGANLTLSAVSGRPYTAKERAIRFDGAGTVGAFNGNRLPWRVRMDLRIDKNIHLSKKESSPLGLNVYFRVSNLLNTLNVKDVYKATGSPTNDGYRDSPDGRDEIRQVLEAGKSVESYNASYQWRVLNANNYGLPRRIYLGAVFDF